MGVGEVIVISQNSGTCPIILGKSDVAAIRLKVMIIWNYQAPDNLDPLCETLRYSVHITSGSIMQHLEFQV